VVRLATDRRLGYPLLSDPGNDLARMCGLSYDLSPGHQRVHRERGRHFVRLPVPAVFVVEPSARVAYAFADVDPARWPDPEALLACLHELRDAHARAA
jgi:peroxiredoxin